MRISLIDTRSDRLFRWLLAIGLLVGFFVGIFLPRLTAQAQDMESQTYNVIAGGGAPFNTDVLAFAPQSLQVHRGDTVTWVLAGFHNIHFEEALSELMIAPEVNGQPLPQVNPAILFPSVESGATYQGGEANSGMSLDPANPMVTFSLVMDVDPGTYSYLCDVHPGMVGVVTVVDAATAVPSPSDALAQGAAELGMNGNAGVEAAIGATLAEPTFTDDGALAVSAGIQAGPAAVQGFFPSLAVIEAGQSVSWSLPANSMEVHTVTLPWAPPGSEFEIIPQDAGPPIVALGDMAFPSVDNGADVGADDTFNSGFVMPGQSFTLRFTEPGVYQYVCYIHSGMQGTVVVMPPS